MEALLFMLNSITIVLMVFMGLRDDRRPANAPHTSIFRMRDVPAGGAARPNSRGADAPDLPEAPDWADWEQAGRHTP